MRNLTRFGMFHLARNLKGGRIVDEIKRSNGDINIPEAFFQIYFLPVDSSYILQ